jgi:hypothetical protein
MQQSYENMHDNEITSRDHINNKLQLSKSLKPEYITFIWHIPGADPGFQVRGGRT